jgi:hypothetical protein
VCVWGGGKKSNYLIIKYKTREEYLKRQKASETMKLS